MTGAPTGAGRQRAVTAHCASVIASGGQDLSGGVEAWRAGPVR